MAAASDRLSIEVTSRSTPSPTSSATRGARVRRRAHLSKRDGARVVPPVMRECDGGHKKVRLIDIGC